MTPLKTETFELSLEDNIIHLNITGPIARESLDAGLDWIESAQNNAETDEANDNFALRVDLPEDRFDGLGQLSQQFKRVGTVMRHAKAADKCAVMTDSTFIRNSARIEGSVIPGMEVRAFDLDETTPAERWLKGQPLIQEADEGPSVADEAEADNPWDNLNVKKLAL